MDYNPFNSINSNSNFSLADDYQYDRKMNTSYQSYKSSNLKRTVFDAIHGHLEFDGYVWEFIDTLEFQRLRSLKQLGNCHFVFPGGTHSRFEHSIGVSYLSNKLVNHLVRVKGSSNNYNIFDPCEDFNVKAVTLAGLLHDLGHGPFSHLFDRKVIKYLK
jgi:HD superfamily phosphohydrolase